HGCKPANENSNGTAKADSSSTASPGQEVTVDIKTWDEAIELVKGHHGKVVVVDVWATYCPPCVEEFPHLVKLQKEHGDQVAAISISAEYDGAHGTTAETHQDKVLAFLKKHDASFQNVLLSDSTESL